MANTPSVDFETLINGETSDGYHTFNELYHHRAILFSVICNIYPHLAWKSKQHHSPEEPMYDGMFIVGIQTPEGQATYHYDLEPYWGLFAVKELERAPEWDGHTPDEAIRRISTLTLENLRPNGRWIGWGKGGTQTYENYGTCSVCHEDAEIHTEH